jgi:hypothetical protein
LLRRLKNPPRVVALIEEEEVGHTFPAGDERVKATATVIIKVIIVV